MRTWLLWLVLWLAGCAGGVNAPAGDASGVSFSRFHGRGDLCTGLARKQLVPRGVRSGAARGGGHGRALV
jgi:hypothetical protein